MSENDCGTSDTLFPRVCPQKREQRDFRQVYTIMDSGYAAQRDETDNMPEICLCIALLIS